MKDDSTPWPVPESGVGREHFHPERHGDELQSWPWGGKFTPLNLGSSVGRRGSGKAKAHCSSPAPGRFSSRLFKAELTLF